MTLLTSVKRTMSLGVIQSVQCRWLSKSNVVNILKLNNYLKKTISQFSGTVEVKKWPIILFLEHFHNLTTFGRPHYKGRFNAFCTYDFWLLILLDFFVVKQQRRTCEASVTGAARNKLALWHSAFWLVSS